MRVEMRNLVNESWSHLTIDELEPDPPIDPAAFDPRRLESH